MSSKRAGTFIHFIDEKLIEEACRSIGQQEFTGDAISICAKFCIRTFTINECIANDREVSTFCATTIFLSSQREYCDRAGGGKRPFSIKRDLQNELTNAVKMGEHPLPVLGYVALPAKVRGVLLSPAAEKYANKTNESLIDTRSLEQEMLMARLTKSETQVVTGSDGHLGVDNVAKKFRLSREEASSIVRRIKVKLEAISI